MRRSAAKATAERAQLRAGMAPPRTVVVALGPTWRVADWGAAGWALEAFLPDPGAAWGAIALRGSRERLLEVIRERVLPRPSRETLAVVEALPERHP